MKKGKSYIIIFSITVAFAFLYLFNYNLTAERKEKEYYNISVITRFTDSESFEIIRQGMEQAANDMRAEMTYISLAEYNSCEEQDELLKREFNNGADAIIISAADSDYIVPTVNSVSSRIPVISIESNVNTKTVKAFYSADNYNMGKALGEKVADEIGENDKNIVILQGTAKSTSISDREKGIIDVLNKNGIDTITVPVKDMNTSKPYFFDNLVFEYKPDVIIATETEVLEKTATYFQGVNGWKGRIYGIGVTGRIASYLEKELISAIVVQNEFNIGYLGVQAAVSSIKNDKIKNAEIDYKVVDSENMYTTECQKLIFPFIR